MKNDESNQAGFHITLVPPSERTQTQKQIQDRFAQEFRTYAGLRIQVQDSSTQILTADRGSPVEFSIRGPDFERLVQLSREMTTRMSESGLMVDPQSNARVGMPEIRLFPDRQKCADLGVSINHVAQTLQISLGGTRAGKLNDQGRRMDIRLRLLAEQRSRPEDLQHILLKSDSGALIPLTSLITSEERPTIQSIARQDGERAVSIWSNLASNVAQGDAIAWLQQQKLPDGYRIVLDGSSASMQQSMQSLLIALAFGLLISYMVLAAQFDSYLHPLTVLSVIPPSISGAVIALTVSGQSLNAFSVIGILLLMGIAKKNSIILVDYANQLRKKGDVANAYDALLKAGPIRLRPILMTSAATTMAAVPLALGLGPGGETRTPMAIAVIGGVTASTLLSLFVVPAWYILADRAIGFFAGVRK
jgi:multidrug efflux pump subunit AcrB